MTVIFLASSPLTHEPLWIIIRDSRIYRRKKQLSFELPLLERLWIDVPGIFPLPPTAELTIQVPSLVEGHPIGRNPFPY